VIRSLLAAVALVAIARGVCAQALTGNDLYGVCFAKNAGATGTCSVFANGYVRGLIQGQINTQAGYLLCVPPNVTGSQIVLMVQKAMRDHPELLNEPQEFIILKAIAESYACKSGQSPIYGQKPN
jgi:Rap1a immunity proteins